MARADRAVRVLLALSLLAGLTVAAYLGERQLVRPAHYTRRPFYDRSMIRLMETLITEGVIGDVNGTVRLSLSKVQPYLDRLVPRERFQRVSEWRDRQARLRGRLETFTAYVDRAEGGLVFDAEATKVVNQRVIAEEEWVIRGRLLDRHGRVLAESRLAPRSGRQSRHYSLGPAAFPLLGHSHPVYGRRGIEEWLNPVLVATAPRPLWARVRDVFRARPAGDDVVLTLDSTLQETSDAALAGRRGAAVLLDVRTGEILAAASRPAFDPATAPGRAWLDAARDRRDRPFIHRALAWRYPVGSAFKVVDVAAVLESGAVDPARVVTCTGVHPASRIRDAGSGGHGRVDLTKALVESCNVYFADVGIALGPVLKTYAERFGFNRELAIPADGLPSLPVVPSLALATSRGNRIEHFTAFRQNPGLVAQAAIGQNLVSATPLQMALVAAAIANGGQMPTPLLVRGTLRGSSAPRGVAEATPSVPEFRVTPKILATPIRPETSRRLTAMMVQVMERGTGRRIPKIVGLGGRVIPVAGKTGTAQIGDQNRDGREDPPHAWFIGFAPADRPRVAVAVVVENAGWGAQVAGPIAIRLLEHALRR